MGGGLGNRGLVEEFSRGRNRSARSRVVQDVGRKRTGRGLAAAVVAVGVVLAGCGAGDDSEPTTTTSPVAAGPVNPWDLPLEERPPLFDPCEEIPADVIEESVGEPVESVEGMGNLDPNVLYSCGWGTEEVEIGLLSTWKSRHQYQEDPAYRVEDGVRFSGRVGMRMIDSSGTSERECYALFFTEQGTMWLSVHLMKALRAFRGEILVNSCDVLTGISPKIVKHFPEGEF